jgi:predicted transcriptional regulator
MLDMSPRTKPRPFDTWVESVPTRHRASALAAVDAADARAAVEALEALRQPGEVTVLAPLLRILARAKSLDDTGVPVSRAAELLDVSQPTVRAWIDRGALDAVPDSRPLQVTSSSLGEALAAVLTLREAGKKRHVLAEAVQILADRETRHDLEDRLAQLAAGDVVEVDVDDLEKFFESA